MHGRTVKEDHAFGRVVQLARESDLEGEQKRRSGKGVHGRGAGWGHGHALRGRWGSCDGMKLRVGS
jgi:hypothetical protein